jgi:hypothetical protein
LGEPNVSLLERPEEEVYREIKRPGAVGVLLVGSESH